MVRRWFAWQFVCQRDDLNNPSGNEDAGPPLWGPWKHMKSLLVFLKGLVLSIYKARERLMSNMWSMCSKGLDGERKNDGNMIGWFRWNSNTILGRKETSKYKVTLSGWNWIKGGSEQREASSLALLAGMITTRNNVFREINLRFEDAIGSNGGHITALRTICSDYEPRGAVVKMLYCS